MYRLAVYFKTPPEYRMNLEESYDLELVTHSRRGKAIAEIKPRNAALVGGHDPLWTGFSRRPECDKDAA